ncbi:MAG: zinc-binding dehydrogenase [Thiohalomonadales bacterium]
MASGSIPNTIAKTFNVEDIQEAHRLLDSGGANGKIVVSF